MQRRRFGRECMHMNPSILFRTILATLATRASHRATRANPRATHVRDSLQSSCLWQQTLDPIELFAALRRRSIGARAQTSDGVVENAGVRTLGRLRARLWEPSMPQLTKAGFAHRYFRFSYSS